MVNLDAKPNNCHKVLARLELDGKLSTIVTQNIDGLPTCSCGGIVKPDVVLYEESLPEETVAKAISSISRCYMLIMGGTSVAVYPAASFV